MYLCRDLTDVSLTNISKYLGKKDHTTVMHAVKRIEEDIAKNDTSLQNILDILVKKLNL